MFDFQNHKSNYVGAVFLAVFTEKRLTLPSRLAYSVITAAATWREILRSNFRFLWLFRDFIVTLTGNNLSQILWKGEEGIEPEVNKTTAQTQLQLVCRGEFQGMCVQQTIPLTHWAGNTPSSVEACWAYPSKNMAYQVFVLSLFYYKQCQHWSYENISFGIGSNVTYERS
jgi:hypothetical protein